MHIATTTKDHGNKEPRGPTDPSVEEDERCANTPSPPTGRPPQNLKSKCGYTVDLRTKPTGIVVLSMGKYENTEIRWVYNGKTKFGNGLSIFGGIGAMHSSKCVVRHVLTMSVPPTSQI